MRSFFTVCTQLLSAEDTSRCNNGKIPMTYIPIAIGSPWVVPSDELISPPPVTNSLAGIP